MKRNHEVTRLEFVQAVREFKGKHQNKLKHLLDKNHPKNQVKAFWEDPEIRAYLARPSVSFSDRHPDLKDSNNKEEHDSSDHYELKVYKYLPEALIYRDSQITSPAFYTSGTGNKKFFNSLFLSFNQQLKDIAVGVCGDISQISAAVHGRILEEPKASRFRFLLQSNWKDAHASTCLTVVDPKSGRPLITLFLNSFKNDFYFEYMKERFLLETCQCYYFDNSEMFKKLKKYVRKTFALDIQDKSLLNQSGKNFIKIEDRAALSINCDNLDLLKNDPEIETIISFRQSEANEDQLVLGSFFPKTLFIDVSHELQLQKEDQNCALYSMNFIQGLIEMLKQPEIANHIFALARNARTHPEAIEDLRSIFCEELKSYLPCYYDVATRQPKSAQELEEFHMHQRWQMGSKSMDLLHPLEEEKHSTCSLL